VSDPKILRRGPERLSLVRPDGRQTLQLLLTKSGVDRSHWKQLSVFNSIGLDAVPEAGKLIKLLK